MIFFINHLQVKCCSFVVFLQNVLHFLTCRSSNLLTDLLDPFSTTTKNDKTNSVDLIAVSELI